MLIPAFTTHAMTSDFLSSISPGWVVMFLDTHRMVFTYHSWLDVLCVVLAFRISILKSSNNFQTTNTGLKISQASKNIRRVLQVILWVFCEITFQEYVSEGISHPVFYGDLVYKLRRVKFEANGLLVSQTPSTSKIWPGDHREDNRSCAWSFHSLVQIFPKALV